MSELEKEISQAIKDSWIPVSPTHGLSHYVMGLLADRVIEILKEKGVIT